MNWLRRRFDALFSTPRIDDAHWTAFLRRTRRAWGTFSSAEEARLRDMTARFLASKAISPAGGLELSEGERLAIAAACCRPALNLGFDALRGWREVIIYPGQFAVRRHGYDEDTGVTHEWDDELAGEAWEHGPIVLSLADLRADLKQPEPGFEVAVHEVAHKLDLLDGAMNGVPALPDLAWRRTWIADFQAAFDHLLAQLNAGEETPIDPYAAEAPEEFFAVTSEYYFTDPATLRAAMPEVAAHLERYYAGG